MRSFVCLAVEFLRVRRATELTQSVVSDLQNPTTVDHTVGRLEVTVTVDWTVMQADHSLSHSIGTDNIEKAFLSTEHYRR